MGKKEKNFENFCNDKIVNLAEGTKYHILLANKRFNEFCLKHHNQSVEELVKEARQDDDPEEYVMEILQDWVNSLAKTLGDSALRSNVSGVNRYLKYLRIRLELKEVEYPNKLEEERYAISDEEIQKILAVASYEKRGYYLALISTGARPAEIAGLRKKDFELIGKKWKAIIPAYLTKKRKARTVFFSSEVTSYVTTLWKRCKSDDDMVFGKSSDAKKSRQNENYVFRYLCDQIGKEDKRFTAKYESTGQRKIVLYCFRSRFFTKVLRKTGDDTAHAPTMGFNPTLAAIAAKPNAEPNATPCLVPLASSVVGCVFETTLTIFGNRYTAPNKIKIQNPISVTVVITTDSIVGIVFKATIEITAERIARPSTSSNTAAFTRIFPSLVFSFPISSKITTETAILVAPSAAPIIIATVQSNPIQSTIKYPVTRGTITPNTPIIAAFGPALIRS